MPAGRRADLDRGFDLGTGPFAHAPVQGLAPLDQVAHRPAGLLQRRVLVVPMALVEVEILDAQPTKRLVHLLVEMFAGKPPVVRGRKGPVGFVRPEDLGGQHVGFAREGTEGVAHDRFGSTGAVGVRGVEEVDAGLVGDSVELGGAVQVPAVEGEPGSEADLRNEESAVTEVAIVHVVVFRGRWTGGIRIQVRGRGV